MKWTRGDDLPQHLQPAPGELPVDAAPPSWPCIVPVDQQGSDSAQSGDPAPESRPWPAPAQPALEPQSWPSYTAPPERQPWETIASAGDAQDGWRFRAADDDGPVDMKRVTGVTAGFVCCLCGSEAKRFVHVDGESKSRDACSPECQHGLDVVFDEWGGEAMAGQNLTQMELKAVADTRVDIYNAIINSGIATAEQMDALAAANMLSAEKFDMLIMTIWNGVRASMQRQSSNGEIPF